MTQEGSTFQRSLEVLGVSSRQEMACELGLSQRERWERHPAKNTTPAKGSGQWVQIMV